VDGDVWDMAYLALIVVAVIAAFVIAHLIRKKNVGGVEEQVSRLRGDANEWTVVAKYKAKRAEANADMLTQQQRVASGLIHLKQEQGNARRKEAEVEHELHKLELEYKKLQAQYRRDTEMIEAEEHVIKKAKEQDLMPTTHQKLKEREGQAQIDVIKHQQMKAIDLEARAEEIRQDMDAADRMELSPHQLIEKLTRHLYAWFEERHKIEQSDEPEPVKQRKLARLDKNIATLEGIIDGRQERLLLSENGGEVRQIEEGSPDSGANDRTEAESPEVEVPAAEPRSRPRRFFVAE
jgi:hypothetical protein